MEEDEVIELVVPESGIERLDTWLAAECEGYSRSRIQGLMKAERLLVNGVAVTKATQRVMPGDQVELHIPPPVPAIPEPEDIPLDVIFEDDQMLVINKPAGLVVHPAPGHLTGTLVNAVLYHCPNLAGIGGVARPGIVHRLDQDTSGVMVVAKTERAMASLVHAFSGHTAIRKVYKTLVHGVPRLLSGRIENLIGRSPYDRKKMAIVEKNGKLAITDYRVIPPSPISRLPSVASAKDGSPLALRSLGEGGSPISLVECDIKTGRTHQIRVHMHSLGCPVIGDAVYGKPPLDKKLDPVPMRQMLHAETLEVRHPVTGEPMVFTAPLPPDFQVYL